MGVVSLGSVPLTHGATHPIGRQSGVSKCEAEMIPMEMVFLYPKRTPQKISSLKQNDPFPPPPSFSVSFGIEFDVAIRECLGGNYNTPYPKSILPEAPPFGGP